MRGVRTTDPAHWVLAAITRGLALGLPPKLIRAWIAKHGQDVSDLVSSDQTFTRLTTIARQHTNSSSSPTAAARRAVSVSRLTVARILAPQPADTSSRIEARDRAVVTVCGLAQLRSARKGWRTTAISQGWLSTECGLSVQSAGFALTSLQGRGWLRQVAKPPGKPAIYKLTTLHEEASRATARQCYDPIGALAAGRTDEPGVVALMSVAHPAWGYSPVGSTPRLGHRHWLRLLAEATGTEPEDVGQTARSWTTSRTHLSKTGVLTGDGRLDLEALDHYAERTGAVAARAAAVTRREERIAERLEELAAARTRRQRAVAGLKHVYKAVGNVLAATTDRATRQAWLRALQPALAGVPEQGQAAVKSELAAALRRAGWERDPARNAATWAVSA